MSDFFEYLEAQAQLENLPFRNAAAIGIDRAERSLGSFVASAQGEKEFAARIALVQEQIVRIATEVCDEYGYDDPAHIARLIVGQMEVISGGANVKGDPNGVPMLNPNSAGDENKNTNPDIPELASGDMQSATEFNFPWNGALPKGETMDMGRSKSSAYMHPQFNGYDEDWDPIEYKSDEGPAAWSMRDDEGMPSEDETEAGRLFEQQRRRDEEGGAPLGETTVDDTEFEGFEGLEDDLSKSDNPNHGEARDIADRVRKRREWHGDDDSWKNYRSDQYHPVNAKTAAERMDLDGLASMMPPSKAVEYLVNEGMPYHEARTRVDEYVNHLNPGWASKHWTAGNWGYSFEDDESAGVDETEMINMAGRPSAEEAANLYQQMRISPEQKNEFSRLLADHWMQMYPQIDPQEISNMIKEGVGSVAGMLSMSSSRKKMSTERMAKLIRYANQWGKFNTVEFDLGSVSPEDQYQINTGLYEGVLVPFDEMWTLESEINAMGYDLDDIAYVQPVNDPKPNQMVLQFDDQGRSTTVPFGQLNQSPSVQMQPMQRGTVQPDEEQAGLDYGVYMANNKEAAGFIPSSPDDARKEVDNVSRLFAQLDGSDSGDDEFEVTSMPGEKSIVPPKRQRQIHKDIAETEQAEDTPQSKYRGIQENSGFRVRREAPGKPTRTKSPLKGDVKLWTGTVNKIMGSIKKDN